MGSLPGSACGCAGAVQTMMAALVWLEDLVGTIRRQGVEVIVAGSGLITPRATAGRLARGDPGPRELDGRLRGPGSQVRPSFAGTVYNLESSNVIAKGGGSSGAHSDICHPEVAHAVWSAMAVTA